MIFVLKKKKLKQDIGYGCLSEGPYQGRLGIILTMGPMRMYIVSKDLISIFV